VLTENKHQKIIRQYDMFLIFSDAAEYLEDVYTIIKQPTGKPKTIQKETFQNAYI